MVYSNARAPSVRSVYINRIRNMGMGSTVISHVVVDSLVIGNTMMGNTMIGRAAQLLGR